MKVLLVHEYYRSSSPSGEDRVFEQERQLLEQGGVTVETLTFRNDSIGTGNGPSVLQTALYTPWSPLGEKWITKSLLRYRPEVVHFHNTFPVFSQSTIVQAKRMGFATVQTLHNFRTICAQAMLMNRNGICEKCLGRYPWPALINRCYRDSFAATLPLAVNIALHRFLGTWHHKVDRFVVLSEFNKKKFIQAGFPGQKIRVKPNFFEHGGHIVVPESRRGDSWLFVGRIKEEKGVQFLPRVWKLLGDRAPVLNVVGDGPCLTSLKSEIHSSGLEKKILLHGRLRSGQVREMLGRSSLLFFPSICYEGFPLVIGEAYEAGVAVAASRIGTAADIVRDGITGVHFIPGNIDDMVEKLSFLADNPSELIRMGKNAREEYEKLYGPDRNFRLLLEIYREALKECGTEYL